MVTGGTARHDPDVPAARAGNPRQQDTALQGDPFGRIGDGGQAVEADEREPAKSTAPVPAATLPDAHRFHRGRLDASCPRLPPVGATADVMHDEDKIERHPSSRPPEGGGTNRRFGRRLRPCNRGALTRVATGTPGYRHSLSRSGAAAADAY